MASDWNGIVTDKDDISNTKRPKGAPTNRGYQPSRVIHVRNLPDDIDMDKVMDLGRPFGNVISAMKIKDTQAFLYMEDLKCAEELVNEYRLKPPKIGWRTVFVQYSQYSRLDVGQKRPEPVELNRSRDSDSTSETRGRRRSRDSHSRRSSSPESSSPPLPDISIPFYMLPRTDEPLESSSRQFVSRPELVSYPPMLSKPIFSHASQPPSHMLISYPCQPSTSFQTKSLPPVDPPIHQGNSENPVLSLTDDSGGGSVKPVNSVSYPGKLQQQQEQQHSVPLMSLSVSHTVPPRPPTTLSRCAPLMSVVPSVHKRPAMQELNSTSRPSDEWPADQEAHDSWDYSAYGTDSDEYFHDQQVVQYVAINC
jgi:hypothetical protein